LRGKDNASTGRARSLRRAQTPAEFALWARIRSRQLGGFKFVRQEPIGRYYVEFVCRDRRLSSTAVNTRNAAETGSATASYAASAIA
jgi:very-short-patch-repair endonuclease